MREPADRNWSKHEVKRFVDQLAAGGHDFQRLVEQLPVIVYTAELGERGAWRYVSPQVEEILGYRPEEFIRDPGLWSSLLHPEDRQRALAVETDEHLGNRDTTPVEYRMHTRDGRTVWMHDEAVLEAGEDGVPVWHGVLYDVSARKETEEELHRALSQQAVVARLGERALQNSAPQELMEAAAELIGKVDGVNTACIWELGRDGRRLELRAGLEEAVQGAGRRVSAARDSHAGAALDSGTHAIVSDWDQE
nr:PAS domain-containing protein [Actinomycetota bacterium]